MQGSHAHVICVTGVLLHPTSLPSPYGVGTIGAEAYSFVDWLVSAGMQVSRWSRSSSASRCDPAKMLRSLMPGPMFCVLLLQCFHHLLGPQGLAAALALAGVGAATAPISEPAHDT